VTNRYLAGLCWLISGGKSTQSPTTARLLSNCAAALQLRPEISLRTKRFLKDIDPEMAAHFEALMTNERAAQYLAEVTFNDPNLVTANNVEDIYAEVQRRAAEKVSSEKDAFYAEKLTALEEEKLAAKAAEIELRKKLEAMELDAESSRLRADRMANDASHIADEHSKQRSTLEHQQSEILLLKTTLEQLTSAATASVSQLSQYRTAARTAADARAHRWTKRIRVTLAVLLFVLTLALGYSDKFILPALPTAYQALGNAVLIAVQALLSIVGLSIFTDWANKPFVALQNSPRPNHRHKLRPTLRQPNLPSPPKYLPHTRRSTRQRDHIKLLTRRVKAQHGVVAPL
jgi:transcriptional antiterminator Rof (Rho-off)